MSTPAFSLVAWDPTHPPSATFEGQWSPEDHAAVSRAIDDYEDCSSDDALSPAGSPWNCIYCQTENGDWFFAHRVRTTGVLSARSAEGLARRIRDSAPSAPTAPTASPVHAPDVDLSSSASDG